MNISVVGLKSKNLKAVYILILVLTLISTAFVAKKVILPNIDARIQFEKDILSGQMEAPYQYRVFKPLVAAALQSLMSAVTGSARAQHAISYTLIVFASFLGIYFFFFRYLHFLFSSMAAVIGVLLLQAVIPLAVTGYYMIGDFISLLFYVIGFNLIFRGRDSYLPLLISLATFNREQMIFLLMFYVIFLYCQNKLFNRSKILIIVACFVSFLIVFLGVRLYFGFKPSQYTIALHIARNLEPNRLFFQIIPLWLTEIAGFAVMCFLAFRRSKLFWRLSFIGLGVYVLLFFLKGNLWELAKFLPAFLIMIPMSLQVLTGKFIDKPMAEPA